MKWRWFDVNVPVLGSKRSIADLIGAIASPGFPKLALEALGERIFTYTAENLSYFLNVFQETTPVWSHISHLHPIECFQEAYNRIPRTATWLQLIWYLFGRLW